LRKGMVGMNLPFEKDKRYTYADYCTWDDDERWELIDGVPYAMSAPTWQHQGVSGNLFFQLFLFLRGKSCKVFSAPFDVRLNAATLDDTVVQPDIVVICDRAKLGGTGCLGAPDLVIEILSPSSASRDMFLKYRKYLQAEVPEYWVVDEESKSVRVFILKDGKYDAFDYTGEAKIPVHVLEGCEIDLAQIFEE